MRALVALGIFAERDQPLCITTLRIATNRHAEPLRGYAIMPASGMMLRGWANLQHALRTSQGALDDALAWKPTPTCSRTKLRLLCSMRRCPPCQDRKALPCATLTTSRSSHSGRCGWQPRPRLGGPSGCPSNPVWGAVRSAKCGGGCSRAARRACRWRAMPRSRAATSVPTCRLAASILAQAGPRRA